MKPQNEELIRQAYGLFGVSSPFDFDRAYTVSEQVHFKDGTWSAYNQELLFNQAKVLIELMDFETLGVDEKKWFTAVLWLWYHHAVSYESRRCRAEIYARKAMDLQGENPYNRLSRLFWHLTCDDVPAARLWLNTSIADWDPDDRQTGIDLTDDYENGNPWLWTYE